MEDRKFYKEEPKPDVFNPMQRIEIRNEILWVLSALTENTKGFLKNELSPALEKTKNSIELKKDFSILTPKLPKTTYFNSINDFRVDLIDESGEPVKYDLYSEPFKIIAIENIGAYLAEINRILSRTNRIDDRNIKAFFCHTSKKSDTKYYVLVLNVNNELFFCSSSKLNSNFEKRNFLNLYDALLNQLRKRFPEPTIYKRIDTECENSGDGINAGSGR